jgi:outer membrane protein insertion porin family
MGKRLYYNRIATRIAICLSAIFVLAGCRSTKHIPDGQYLLWKNKLVLNSDKIMTNKGEIKDNLDRIIVQKPNSNYLGLSPTKVPKKLWSYNRRYKKLHNRPDSLLPKSVERPTIFDSSTMPRSVQNMKSYLFNQGYFYATVRDTVVFRNKKAIATYAVNAGANYLINKINYNIDDSGVKKVVLSHLTGTVLKKGKEFTYSMLEEERSRIAEIVTNHGYKRFTLENITFKIDTMEKSIFRVAGSPFENAVNFISQVKSNKKSTIDIDVNIAQTDDTLCYNVYRISEITVYPDFNGVNDLHNPNMISKTINGIEFRYHDQYVRPSVLYEHIFMNPGNLYSKENEDKTAAKLGELGIFQYIRTQAQENRVSRDSVKYNIYLSRGQKHDFSTNYEISNGSTYSLGNSVGVNYRNRNFLKGANLLSVSVSGGLETFYYDSKPGDIYDRFEILTRYYGINASVDFPKFLAPLNSSVFSRSNLPHTVITGGENVIHRVNYFRLINSSATFSYNWHETDTKTWGLTPAFFNIIRLPEKDQTDSFRKLLSVNQYLKNSYKQTFIEGEGINFKIDDNAKRNGINYSYVRLAFEEAGSLVSLIDKVGAATYGSDTIAYSRYTKFDFDARHYFTLRRSVMAFRLYGGVGTPYGNSVTLPYIKQYFAGGPYSLRGWRIRTLGPGSYKAPVDSNGNTTQVNQIDRTGDIKMEMNGEYRFPVAPLFAGALKMNGALFADAGNIWLANKSSNYVGGEFALNKLGQDIAMDLGAGTRFDIASFLTIRVDVAVPIKKPSVAENNGWVIREIDFNNPTWRKDNVILNISIGYPF